MTSDLTIGEARTIAGSLGFPTKMPGSSYGLPAAACRAGSQLAKVAGSICANCYALRDRYGTDNPRKAQARRLQGTTHPLWVDAMVLLLSHLHRKKTFKVDLGVRNAKARGLQRFAMNEAGWHRWHDSGDLQSVAHLERIVEIACRTPSIRHWLPTRELAILRAYLGAIPDNLTIRVSATMVDGAAPDWPLVSVVHSAVAPVGAYECPAPTQDHKCVSCRACWSRDVRLISYLEH